MRLLAIGRFCIHGKGVSNLAIERVLPVKAPQSLRSFGQMLDVYRICIEIRRLSRHLIIRSKDLAIISINANTSASRSRENRAVYQALASEIGDIALNITEQISSVVEKATYLANEALSGLTKKRVHDAYALTLAEMRNEDGRVFLRQKLDACVRDIEHSLVNTDTLLAEITRRSMELQELNSRTMIISRYFRIEAGRDVSSDQFFGNVAESIKSHAARIGNDISSIMAVLQSRIT